MENSNVDTKPEVHKNGLNGASNGASNGLLNGFKNGATNGDATNGATNGVIKILETEEEKTQRTKSLVIVYFTLFLQSLGLAIAMTGIWPFLDKVS